MGKKSTPKADPRIGEAAMASAALGKDYMAFMKEQAAITNGWASEDRARYKTLFQPVEDKFVADAQTWDSPERQNNEANAAAADVAVSARTAAGSRQRGAMAVGINPASGRFLDAEAKASAAVGLADAGARNMARKQVQQMGEAKRADAINLGKGMAVNPATSIGLANGASSSGFSGAMQGYGQQGSLLNTQFQQQMDAHNSKSSALGGIFGAIGNVVGASGMLSTKKAKTDMREAPGVLDAVRKMPVEKWRYKDGQGDGGEHIGTYAEDFKKHTGLGDGNSIGIIDAIGVTMGALKELDAKVSKLSGARAA